MSGFSEIVKLNPIELSGHVTVELFDALTGRKQQEIKGKNFISVKAAELLRRMQIAALTAGVAKYSVGQPVNNGWSSYYGYWSSPFFNYLVLTDYSDAEAASTDVLVRGSLKGWCRYYPSADADLLAGYANQEESWATDLQAHLVYDFATDKANGTFRSIYLASSYTPGVYNGEYKRVLKCKAVRGYSNPQYADSYFWGNVGNVIYKISMTTGEEVASYDMLESVTSFSVNGGYIYYLPGAGTTLKRYEISGGTKDSVTLSATANSLFNNGTYLYAYYTSGFQISRITMGTFVVDGNKNIVPSDGHSSYGWAYMKIVGGVLTARFYDSSTTVDPDTGYQMASIDWDAGTSTQITVDWYQDRHIFTDGTNWYVFLSNTGYMGNQSFTATNYAFYTTDAIQTGDYNIFSRKLLPADVTKAANQTMKITYDIFIS